MSFGKVLLVFVCIVFFEMNCTECCDDFDCSFYTTEDDCKEWSECTWESSGTCRDWTCADENSQQGCVFNKYCAWTGTACKIPTSCSELKQTQCSMIKIGDDTCTWIGGACKAVTCDDFKNSNYTCEESTMYVILDGLCYYSAATGTSEKSCKLTTSCAEWSDKGKVECEKSNRCFENERCMFDETTNKCTSMSCANLSSSGECWSIRQWNKQEGGYGYLCKWSETDNSCTSATSCADFNGKGKDMCKINPFRCYWDEGSDTCSPKDCESFGNDKSKCYIEGCYYRDICAVEDPSPSSSSAIFTPMFLIAVILALVL